MLKFSKKTCMSAVKIFVFFAFILNGEKIYSQPDDSFYQGDYYFKIGKYEEAKNEFLKNKENSRNLLGAATSARFSGKNSEAVRYYSQLIEKAPNFAEGYFGRALAYRELEEYNKAINDLEQCIFLDKNEYYYAGLGDLYMLIGKTREAKNILEDGNREFPESILIKKLLARSYSK
ncbi:MAG: tetratricopeptide repeat protein [Fusobacteriaceae bacterium]